MSAMSYKERTRLERFSRDSAIELRQGDDRPGRNNHLSKRAQCSLEEKSESGSTVSTVSTTVPFTPVHHQGEIPTVSPQEQNSCAFLQKLPREIRDRIYGYVFYRNRDQSPSEGKLEFWCGWSTDKSDETEDLEDRQRSRPYFIFCPSSDLMLSGEIRLPSTQCLQYMEKPGWQPRDGRKTKRYVDTSQQPPETAFALFDTCTQILEEAYYIPFEVNELVIVLCDRKDHEYETVKDAVKDLIWSCEGTPIMSHLRRIRIEYDFFHKLDQHRDKSPPYSLVEDLRTARDLMKPFPHIKLTIEMNTSYGMVSHIENNLSDVPVLMSQLRDLSKSNVMSTRFKMAELPFGLPDHLSWLLTPSMQIPFPWWTEKVRTLRKEWDKVKSVLLVQNSLSPR